MLRLLGIFAFSILSLTLAQIVPSQPSYWYAEKMSFSLGCEDGTQKTARLFFFLNSEDNGVTFYGRGTFQLTDYGTHNISLTGSANKGKFFGYFQSNFRLINLSKLNGTITPQNITGVISGKVNCGMGKTATYANRVQLLRTKNTQMPSEQSTLPVNRIFKQNFVGEINKVKFIEKGFYFSSFVGDLTTKANLRYLNIETRQTNLVLEQSNPIDIITDFDSNGESFVVSAYSGIALYNSKEKFKYIGEISGKNPGLVSTRVSSIAFDSTGKLLVADVGSYVILDPKDLSVLRSLSKNSRSGTVLADFLAIDKYAFVDTFGVLRIFNMKNLSEKIEINASSVSTQRSRFIETSAVSQDKKLIVIGTTNPVIYDVESKKLTQLTGSSNTAQSIGISPNKKYVAAAYKGGGCIIWDLASGKRIWRSPSSTARSLAFSADGRYLAVGSDSTIELYELPKGSF